MDEAPESEYTQEQITSLSWVLETDISDISFTRHSLHSPWKEKKQAAQLLAKLWLTIKTLIKPQWSMSNNSFFIQDSKLSDWNVSETLSLAFFVLVSFFFSSGLAFKIDERASRQDFR